MATLGSGSADLLSTGAPLLETGRAAILREAEALGLLAASLDETFERAVEQLLATERRVIVSGVGKSGHVGRKLSATLAATGTPSFFLHAGEAAHGDLGMVQPGDTLVLLSNSGFSRELRPLIGYARRFGIPMIAIVSRMSSPLARAADIVLRLPPAREACPAQIAPTTSTTMMLALGDALAIAAMERRGVTRSQLALWHPGGEIGSRFAPIEAIIDCSEPLPLVRADAPMRDVVFEMTSGGKGVAAVVDETGALIGIVTDGDVRRGFDQVLTACARDIMTPNPVTVPCGITVEEVLALMNARKITALFVTQADDPSRPVGIAHIHDIVP
ncbi:MAG TPA: KpsF/GutQ family sugar-phosphate isomerase [Sphingobium sp.]|nr:KpsF/GutQ family sugar-phosphate isomerase [Sphingobium sp.]